MAVKAALSKRTLSSPLRIVLKRIFLLFFFSVLLPIFNLLKPPSCLNLLLRYSTISWISSIPGCVPHVLIRLRQKGASFVSHVYPNCLKRIITRSMATHLRRIFGEECHYMRERHSCSLFPMERLRFCCTTSSTEAEVILREVLACFMGSDYRRTHVFRK